MRGLMQIAADMKVRVHAAHFDDDPDLWGYYDHSRRIIVLRLDLTPYEMRSAMAHELAHAFYGDSCSSASNERRAERYAAQLLIDPEDYARAEAGGSDIWAIADDLRVTVELVQTYRDQCLQRLGGRTYGRSWRTGISPELARKLSV